ncbi:MAG: GTPase Era [Nitrospinae bacterium]|nr:GTPase Era [Nitrospinota bacterium]MEC4671112.1 GTPase Era [Nitrospirota bacterium]
MKFGTMAILGRPNVGKSTLVNRLVRQKVAIVSDKPQTTRTRILGVAHFPQAQVALLDTPGLHRPRHRLNKKMVQAAWDTLYEADLVAVMVDGRLRPGPGDRFVLEQVADRWPSHQSLPLLLVNKIDLMAKPKVLPIIKAYSQMGTWSDIIPMSAKTGLNVDRLIEVILNRVGDHGEGYSNEFVTDQSMRNFAAEIIREKVLDRTRAELPYGVAVKVEEFIEQGNLARISAFIWVEKQGQKAIVIGKGGAGVKAIGTAARLEMEQVFEMKVFLELRVKVKEAWRDTDHLLAELGY